MNLRTCGSIILFEGDISCFFNNNCNFLQIWLCAFARFSVLPGYTFGSQTLQPYSRTGRATFISGLVNCIPERGHNWIIKHSILFSDELQYRYQFEMLQIKHMGRTMQKRVFRQMRAAKVQISLCIRAI